MARLSDAATLAGSLCVCVCIVVPAQTVDHPLKVNQVTTPPTVIKQVEVAFKKPLSRPLTKADHVKVHVVLDQKAKPIVLTVQEPSEIEELNKNALEAVKRYVFTPALLNGKPVAVELSVDVRYAP